MDNQKKQALVNYVSNQVADGQSLEDLRSRLLDSGWSSAEIDEVFNAVEVDQPQSMNEDVETATSSVTNGSKGFTKPGSGSGGGNTMFLVWVVGALFVIGISGAVAYSMVGDSLLDGFSDSENAPSVQEIMDAHQNIDSFSYDSLVELNVSMNPSSLEEDQRSSLQQFLDNVPDSGGANSEIPSQLTIRMEASGEQSLATSSSSAGKHDFILSTGSGNELDEVFSIETRHVDDTTYVLGNTLPNFGFITLKSLEGQWISFSSQEFSADDSGTVSGLPIGSLEGLETGRQISADTYQEISAALVTEEVIVIDNTTLADRDNNEVYRYDLSLNPSAVPTYQAKTKEIITRRNPEFVNTPQYEQLISSMEDLRSTVEDLQSNIDRIQVWVSAETSLVQRVELESELTSEEIQDTFSGTEASDAFTSGAFSFEMNTGYNQPVEVETPSNARSFEEVVGDLFSFGGQQQNMNTESTQGGTSDTVNVEVEFPDTD